MYAPLGLACWNRRIVGLACGRPGDRQPKHDCTKIPVPNFNDLQSVLLSGDGGCRSFKELSCVPPHAESRKINETGSGDV